MLNNRHTQQHEESTTPSHCTLHRHAGLCTTTFCHLDSQRLDTGVPWHERPATGPCRRGGRRRHQPVVGRVQLGEYHQGGDNPWCWHVQQQCHRTYQYHYSERLQCRSERHEQPKHMFQVITPRMPNSSTALLNCGITVMLITHGMPQVYHSTTV